MIFLGAGASAPFGISTSKELTQKLSELLQKDHPNLLADMNKFYNQFVGTPDFETYLTQLSTLTDPSIVPLSHSTSIFLRQHPEYKSDYRAIINEMYSEICKICNEPFIKTSSSYLSPEKLEEVYSYTYDALIGLPLVHGSKKQNPIIFTTNYDPSIELWCQRRNLRCMDGSTPMHNPEIRKMNPIDQHLHELQNINQNRSDPNDYEPDTPQKIGLVRLHGSVWTYESDAPNSFLKITRPIDKLAFSDLYDSYKSKQPGLIFPGQEDNLRIGKWDSYYQFFKSQLRGICIFIGYSFRHQVINEQVVSAIRSGLIKKLIIVAPDPDKLIMNLFQGSDTAGLPIIKISERFGTKQFVWKINLEWYPEEFQQSWGIPEQPHDLIRGWKQEIKKMYN